MSNPNAIKWWCRKFEKQLYIHSLHSKMPASCIECDDEKCFINKDPLAVKMIYWMKDCPYNNEVLYEKGLMLEPKIIKASKIRHKASRLIYSMPPVVVHARRNEYMNKIQKSLFLKLLHKIKLKSFSRFVQDVSYLRFASNLSEEVKRHVLYYKPELAHWLNPEMTKEMSVNNWVTNHSHMLGKSHYGE